jgi:uncharacterized protein with NRDE domain
MCLIVFAWRPGHAQPLIVAANRDEFYARPSLPLAQWPDAPGSRRARPGGRRHLAGVAPMGALPR